MEKVQILCLDNSEFAEYDAINRGFRGDIYIKLSDEYYNLNIYDIVRLQQDVETEIEEYGVFSPEPNLVIVLEVNHKEIEKVVYHLHSQKYFDTIMPVKKDKINSIKLLDFGNTIK